MLSPEMVPVPGVPVPELPAGLTVTGTLMGLALIAVIMPETGEVTVDVLTGNVAEVAPCGTVTVAGTVALGVELERPTRTPPAPAGRSSVTIPLAD
jgi:hypothetical protein